MTHHREGVKRTHGSLEEARAWVERLEVSRERGVDPGQPLADYVAQLGDRWARGIDHIQKYGPEPRSSCRRPQWNSGTPAARCHLRLFPYPRRLRLLRGPLRAYQASGVRRLLGPLLARTPTLATLESLAPRLHRPERLPERVLAVGPRRAIVGMLTGCVQRAFFPDVNAATARVLAAEGCDVVLPRSAAGR